MINKIVYIPGPKYGVDRMFLRRGWFVTDREELADLVNFTGGEDIAPSLYNQLPHPKTYPNYDRDRIEVMAFALAVKHKKPMAGICRGGQLINALLGGDMWQDVDGHWNGNHDCTDTETGEVFQTNSLHHQMMIPRMGSQVLAFANVCNRREKMKPNGDKLIITNKFREPEIIWYPTERALCYQAHPEGMDSLADRYFDHLEKKLGV